MGDIPNQYSFSSDAEAQHSIDKRPAATATQDNGATTMTQGTPNDDASVQLPNDSTQTSDGNTRKNVEKKENKDDAKVEKHGASKGPEMSVQEGETKKEATIEEEENEGLETQESEVEERPPLPPRPSLLQSVNQSSTPLSTPKRPALVSKPTTALSSVDIQTLSFPDGTRGTFSTPAHRSVSESLSVRSGLSTVKSTPHGKASHNGSEFDDTTSLMNYAPSYAPTLRANGDLASLLDEGLNSQSPAWKLLSTQSESANLFESVDYEDMSLANFDQEFDQIEAIDSKEGNEGMRLTCEFSGSSNYVFRGGLIAMEVQAQTLFDTIFSWQTHL
jgi:hypothetical protein